MADWYPSSGLPYEKFLQTASFFKDVTSAQAETTRSIERSTADIIGAIGDVDAGMRDLNASFRWGFSQSLAVMGGMADSLRSLIQIAKTPAQTAAYEQFEIARDAFQQALYPECLEALDKAINGDHTSPGYKLEWRFHQLVGVVRLGVPGRDQSLTDPARAEASFLLAARYAKANAPKEAARALVAAGWAAYVQQRLADGLAHTEFALEMNGQLPEAHFQLAKFLASGDDQQKSLRSLRQAIDLDANYVVKAAGDGEFRRHKGALDGFFSALRAEKTEEAAAGARAALHEFEAPLARFPSLKQLAAVTHWNAVLTAPEEWPLPRLVQYSKAVLLGEREAVKGQWQKLEDERKREEERLNREEERLNEERKREERWNRTFRAAGLEWQFEPSEQEMTWPNAMDYAAKLQIAGGGWRLPSKEELLALYHAKKASAQIAEYPGMGSGWYWSSSPLAGCPQDAWAVSFNNGNAYYNGVGTNRVRCVR